jgi:hypothetical protein
MNAAMTWILLAAVVGQGKSAVGSESGQATKTKREFLLELYAHEAESYTIYRDASRKEPLELQHEPVYIWTNLVREGEQYGSVFVWTYRGRAEAIGTFFSFPPKGTRSLCHEFHSLSLTVLDVVHPAKQAGSWVPEAPGIELTALPVAPKPGRTTPQRLVQMRALSRDFSATTRDAKERQWELRLLPQPLYRYESTDPNVLDGAVFAFVTSAGTDPEAILVIEARPGAAGGQPAWHYAVGRFTDLNIVVRHKGQEIFSGPFIEHDAPRQDPKNRYRVFRDRYIRPVEDQAR